MWSRIFSILCIVSFLFPAQQDEQIVVYTDKKSGKMTQFEMAIMKNVVSLMNKKENRNISIKFEEMNSFQDAFRFMDQHQTTNFKHLTVAMNEISYTVERDKNYDFTVPYMFNYFTVMTFPHSRKLHKDSDFNTKRIYGVTRGSIFDEMLSELSKSEDITYKTYLNANEMYGALLTKEIDFIFSDYVDSWEFGLKAVFFHKKDQIDRFCFMLPKDSELTPHLDNYLSYFLKSQRFFKLVKDYFGTEAVMFFKQSLAHNK